MYDIPILLIIFNRLETTKQVFSQISKVKPKQLFIAADGPRISKNGESEICEETRNWVKSNINWDCEVKTLFREQNLGCGLAVSGAINWFFDNVDMGIVLEDDCMPSNSFFQYCKENLFRYKNNESVMHIAGYNPLNKIKSKYSYTFTNIQHCWGWASWKRAWKKYKFNIILDKNIYLNSYFNNKHVNEYWSRVFKEIESHLIDTWDYQWTYCILLNQGLCLLPTQNLISNIGFASGTHFNDPNRNIAARYEIESIAHPKKIEINKKIVNAINFIEYGIDIRFSSKIRKIIKRIKKRVKGVLT